MGMSLGPSLIKSEYFGGPLDGDKRPPAGYAEYYRASEPTLTHRYHASDRGMEYGGVVPLSAKLSTAAVRELRVGLER